MANRPLRTRPERVIARDIENAMVAQTRLSDVSPASVLSVLSREALAPEAAGFYLNSLMTNEAYFVLSPAVSGGGLDERLADFNLSREGEAASYGVITLYRADGEVGDSGVINTGHRVGARTADGELIEFTIRGPVPAGLDPDIASAPSGSITLLDGFSEIDAIVDASAAGSNGNVGSGAIVEWIDAQPAKIGTPASGTPAGGLTNKRAFTTGKDEDSDDVAKQIFRDWLTLRSRGTPSAIRIAAERYKQTFVRDGQSYTVRPVSSAAVEELFVPRAADDVNVVVYVMGQNGRSASAETIAAVQQRIDGYTDPSGAEIEGYRGAGQLVEVTRPDLLEATVLVTLEGATESQRARLETRIEAMVAALAIGAGLNRASIYGEICQIGRIANANIVLPAADQPAGPYQKWVPASITVQGG